MLSLEAIEIIIGCLILFAIAVLVLWRFVKYWRSLRE